MSSRYFKHPYTQGERHVYLPVTVLPNGSGTPTLGEGDANGSYYSVAFTSTGIITLTTKEQFLACVGCFAQLSLATPAGPWTVMPLVTRASSSPYTFTIALNMFLTGTLTNVAAATGNQISVWAVFRNSIGVP